MTPINRWVAVSAILAGVGALCLSSALAASAMRKPGLIAPFLTGYAASAALSVPSYLSLAWSINRPDKIFYGVFVGGIFFRLIGLAATALLVYWTGRWSMAAVLLPFVFGLILASFIEMYFIQREART